MYINIEYSNIISTFIVIIRDENRRINNYQDKSLKLFNNIIKWNYVLYELYSYVY